MSCPLPPERAKDGGRPKDGQAQQCVASAEDWAGSHRWKDLQRMPTEELPQDDEPLPIRCVRGRW